MKYRNKDGIELDFDGMSAVSKLGSGVDLIQEVIIEAIKILDFAPSYKGCEEANNKCKEFLRVNFDINEEKDNG